MGIWLNDRSFVNTLRRILFRYWSGLALSAMPFSWRLCAVDPPHSVISWVVPAVCVRDRQSCKLWHPIDPGRPLQTKGPFKREIILKDSHEGVIHANQSCSEKESSGNMIGFNLTTWVFPFHVCRHKNHTKIAAKSQRSLIPKRSKSPERQIWLH